MTLSVYYFSILTWTVITAHENATVAFIQTDNGLHESKLRDTLVRHKRFLSTKFGPHSTYPAQNGMHCYVCAPGFYKRSDCTQNMTTFVCEKCPDGRYSSTYNVAIYCAICRNYCSDVNAVIIRNCNSTADIKCRCKDGYYNYSKGGGEWVCVRHSVCQAGEEVHALGSHDKDTDCRQCPQGTFSLHKSSRKCTNCTRCSSDQVTKVYCHPVKGTICGHKVKVVDLTLEIALPIVGVVLIAAVVFLIVLWRKEKLKTCYSWFCPLPDEEKNSDINFPQVAIFQTQGNIKDNLHKGDENSPIPEWRDVFRTTAKKIKIKEWKPFFRTLFSKRKDVLAAERQIEVVCYDHRYVDEQIYQCFLAWSKQCEEISLYEILSALNQHNMSDIAFELQTKFPALVNKRNCEGVDDLYPRNQ